MKPTNEKQNEKMPQGQPGKFEQDQQRRHATGNEGRDEKKQNDRSDRSGQDQRGQRSDRDRQGQNQKKSS